jgi:hypothetical protein
MAFDVQNSAVGRGLILRSYKSDNKQLYSFIRDTQRGNKMVRWFSMINRIVER